MGANDFGPIWRSTVRHRAFGLLVLEVFIIFIIISNLLVTSQWFVKRVKIPTGHRETDLVDVLVRRPSPSGGSDPAAVVAQHQRETAALSGLPGVVGVAPVSSHQGDDSIAAPNLFWTEGGAPVATAGCAGIDRSVDGVVVGWAVEGGASLPDVIDLSFLEGEGGSFGRAGDSVIVTACLARALFGTTSAVGRMVLSNRYAPARVVGVVSDVRMHVPFLPHTQVTAIFPGLADDGRQVDYLIRTAPGQTAAVRDAAQAALAKLLPPAGSLINARVFAPAGPRMLHNAYGTLKVFGVIGGGVALAALLGNITLAALVVASRRRIIGIRRALGATRWDVFRTLWIEALIPGLVGVLLALPLTVFLVAQAGIVFSGLRLTMVDVGVTLVLVALVGVPAKVFPAWQATRVPPSEVGRTP